MMTAHKSQFIKESTERGFLYQCTDVNTLDEKMSHGPIVAYLGFDATASSFHVGNLVQIMWLRLLQQSGHKPIVLMGDGTTRVGDPSGKDEMRKILTPEQIDQNVESLKKIFQKYITFGDGPTDAILLRNSEWLLKLNYIDFLRDYGKHFSVNRMLTMDSVKQRLDREQNLSFLEFNYMIFQAYDFVELNRHHNCMLEMGGQDQWGNIIMGADLVRRVEQKEAYGITSPLIATADGRKMGKTAKGAVWLNADQLSPFEYWQFWRNTQDADVGRFLKLFTDLPMERIQELESLEGAQINEAKKVLADEATKLCHGEEAVAQARATAKELFESSAGSLDQLPSVDVSNEDLAKGISILELFKQAGLASSNGETRRLIKGGGAKLNDQAITDDSMIIEQSHFKDQDYLKLSAGKKRHALVKMK